VKLELCEPQLSVLERGHHLVYRSPTCVHHLVQMVDVVQMVSFIGELTIKPINYRYITYKPYVVSDFQVKDCFCTAAILSGKCHLQNLGLVSGETGRHEK